MRLAEVSVQQMEWKWLNSDKLYYNYNLNVNSALKHKCVIYFLCQDFNCCYLTTSEAVHKLWYGIVVW